ncbi:MAG TPA: acetyl-CoA carboxylase biotin carboxyl carrier protein [Phycisphaerales bacterium]|nr:acetyl-CoA carboxylase biotin carboxyl carrier protein [Phycisphaerales bacterium]
MIDLAKLKDLVSLMSANDLSEVNLKQGDESIVIKRGAQAQTIINHQPVMYGAGGGGGVAPMPAHSPAHAPAPAPAPAAQAPATKAAAPAGNTIDSPMVGTFYSKPNPDAKSFVTPGQNVGPDTVVCIIEAMKVFNEIKAEKAGVIESLLVKDGQAVEFGQKLFSLK